MLMETANDRTTTSPYMDYSPSRASTFTGPSSPTTSIGSSRSMALTPMRMRQNPWPEAFVRGMKEGHPSVTDEAAEMAASHLRLIETDTTPPLYRGPPKPSTLWSPWDSHVQSQLRLQRRPIALGYPLANDGHPTFAQQDCSAVAKVAHLPGSGALAVFFDDRINVYDFGQPQDFSYLIYGSARPLLPLRSIRFQACEKPLAPWTVSFSDGLDTTLAATVDHLQQLHLYTLAHDVLPAMSDSTERVLCPVGSTVAFCAQNTLLVHQQLDGYVRVTPLLRDHNRYRFGLPQTLLSGGPVHKIVSAATSLGEKHLVVVEQLGADAQPPFSTRARLFNRAGPPQAPWVAVGARANLHGAWLLPHNDALITHHVRKPVTVEKMTDSGPAARKRTTSVQILRAFHPPSGLAVVWRRKKNALMLTHIGFKSTAQPINLAEAVAAGMEPQHGNSVVFSQSTEAIFSADGSSLLLRHQDQVFVLRDILGGITVTRPADTASSRDGLGSVRLDGSHTLHVPQHGHYLVAQRTGQPPLLYGLIPAMGPVPEPQEALAASARACAPRAASQAAPWPTDANGSLGRPTATTGPQQPVGILWFFWQTCWTWIKELFGHRGLRHPHKHPGFWPL